MARLSKCPQTKNLTRSSVCTSTVFSDRGLRSAAYEFRGFFWGCQNGSVVVGIFFLAGCMVGPDYETPHLERPVKWSASGSKETVGVPHLAYWWSWFNVPKLIDKAIAGNLRVRTVKTKVRKARTSNCETAGGQFLAHDGSGEASRAQIVARCGGKPTVSSLFRASLDADWELNLFGTHRKFGEVARYGLETLQEELRSTLLALIGDAATINIEARGYQARIGQTKKTMASQTETARLPRTRTKSSATSAVDVANADGQTQTTETNIPSLNNSYLETDLRLGILTGQAPGVLLEGLEKSSSNYRPLRHLSAGVSVHILQVCHDVRLAERELAHSTDRIGAAEPARYFAISLTGGLAVSAANPWHLAKNSTVIWSFGPTLSVPIFKVGELAAAADVARTQRDQAFLAYKAGDLTALENVEMFLDGRRLRSLDKAITSYRDAGQLYRSLCQSSPSIFLEVLDAERSVNPAKDSRIQNRVSLANHYVAMQKALGRDLDAKKNSTKPEIQDENAGPFFALGNKQ